MPVFLRLQASSEVRWTATLLGSSVAFAAALRLWRGRVLVHAWQPAGAHTNGRATLTVCFAPAPWQVTGTFKQKKVQLRTEGIDPVLVSDPVLWLPAASESYVPFTPRDLHSVATGQSRL